MADLPSGLPQTPEEASFSGRPTAQQLKEVKAALRRFYDRVYYGDILPPVGSKHMSYARFVELLYKKRIKRIYLLSDGQVALLEVGVRVFAACHTDSVSDSIAGLGFRL